MPTIAERKHRLGLQLAKARIAHGKTQDDVAEILNVSRVTVANWEAGKSNPDIFDIEDLEDFFGEDPIYRLKNYRNPRLYDDYVPGSDPARAREALLDIIANQASPAVIEDLLFLFHGKHGSDPDAVCQEMVAMLQSPLVSRHAIAVSVRSAYTFAAAHGNLSCPDAVQPDLPTWDHAIDSATEAGLAGEPGYAGTK